MTTASCPLCDGTTHAAVGVKRVASNTYKCVRCATCRLVFVTDVPSAEALRAHYRCHWDTTASARDQPEAEIVHAVETLRFQRRLRELARWSSSGRLLDVGCQQGTFLTLARRQGWTVHGVELVPDAAAAARAQHLDVHVGTLESAPIAPARMQVVTLWHILEHVPEPRAVLARAHQLLKPGGLVAIETPNIDGRAARRAGINWEYVTPPAHLRYFGPHSLQYALAHSGYRVLDVRTEGGTGLGEGLTRAGLGRARVWIRRHYQQLWWLRQLYMRTCGVLSPSRDDMLIAYAQKTP